VSETKWRVTVDTDLCIGSGGCVFRVPEVFELGESRQACPRHEVLAASEAVMEAAENCPVEAITIVEDGSGVVVFPPED
jgi:ferredoxin